MSSSRFPAREHSSGRAIVFFYAGPPETVQIVPVFGAEFGDGPSATVGVGFFRGGEETARGVEEVPEAVVFVYLDFASLLRVEDWFG